VQPPEDRDRKKRKLGSPPDDWKSSSDSGRYALPAKTQRLPRQEVLGGPPREFGDQEKPSSDEPRVALVVSADRMAAATVAFKLAEVKVGLRLAFSVSDLDVLVDGADAIFVVVGSPDDPILARLAPGREGKPVVLLAPDAATARALEGRARLVLEPPWGVVPALRSLLG
jgi:hypothetical protein